MSTTQLGFNTIRKYALSFLDKFYNGQQVAGSSSITKPLEKTKDGTVIDGVIFKLLNNEIEKIIAIKIIEETSPGFFGTPTTQKKMLLAGLIGLATGLGLSNWIELEIVFEVILSIILGLLGAVAMLLISKLKPNTFIKDILEDLKEIPAHDKWLVFKKEMFADLNEDIKKELIKVGRIKRYGILCIGQGQSINVIQESKSIREDKKDPFKDAYRNIEKLMAKQ